MRVTVANRSPVALGPLVDAYYPLSDKAAFMGSADAIIVGLPLLPETTGFVDMRALAAMKKIRCSDQCRPWRRRRRKGAVRCTRKQDDRRGRHRHLVQVSLANEPITTARDTTLSHPRQLCADAAHVGLDEWHDPPTAGDDGKKHQPSCRRQDADQSPECVKGTTLSVGSAGNGCDLTGEVRGPGPVAGHFLADRNPIVGPAAPIFEVRKA